MRHFSEYRNVLIDIVQEQIKRGKNNTNCINTEWGGGETQAKLN